MRKMRLAVVLGVALLLLFHVGLLGALATWFHVIWLGIHDCGRGHYRPSLMGQVLGDQSPLVFLIPALALITTALLAVSEILVRRRLLGEEIVLSRILALAFAVWMAIPAIVMIYLLQTDLQHVPQPLHIGITALSMCGLLPGIATLLLFGRSGRLAHLWANVGMPFALTVTVAFLPEVRRLSRLPALPYGYPSVRCVLLATAVVLGAVVGIKHVVSHIRPAMTSLALLSAGIWGWVLFALACSTALIPLEYMCLSPETDIQRASVRPVFGLFSVGWVILALVQVDRWRKRRLRNDRVRGRQVNAS